jgi:hypothetical protein
MSRSLQQKFIVMRWQSEQNMPIVLNHRHGVSSCMGARQRKGEGALPPTPCALSWKPLLYISSRLPKHRKYTLFPPSGALLSGSTSMRSRHLSFTCSIAISCTDGSELRSSLLPSSTCSTRAHSELARQRFHHGAPSPLFHTRGATGAARLLQTAPSLACASQLGWHRPPRWRLTIH